MLWWFLQWFFIRTDVSWFCWVVIDRSSRLLLDIGTSRFLISQNETRDMYDSPSAMSGGNPPTKIFREKKKPRLLIGISWTWLSMLVEATKLLAVNVWTGSLSEDRRMSEGPVVNSFQLTVRYELQVLQIIVILCVLHFEMFFFRDISVCKLNCLAPGLT